MSRSTTLISIILAASLLACTGSSDVDDNEPAPTCEAMCERLLSEILDGCGKADDQAECEAECEEHLAEGEADEQGLACALEAGTCEAWRLCGDLL